MAKPYSYDFRQKVMQAVELDGLKKGEACELFNISRNTLNLWFQRRIETGGIQPKTRQPCHKIQTITDWDNFREFANANSDKTQAEMAELWEVKISARSISRALDKINFTRKKKTYGYRQRDEVKRTAFREQLGDPKASDLIYVDESGMDERDDYGYAWSEAGHRVYGLKSGRRQGRINMIAGYRDGQIIAPFTVEGACNRTVFELWLETCLIPLLQKGQRIVIDNATFHHGGRIAALIEAAGCSVVYLPPYSPDLNRIEKCWAWLKSRIRKRLRDSDNLRDAIEFVLRSAAS
jgi:hypothetical protein